MSSDPAPSTNMADEQEAKTGTRPLRLGPETEDAEFESVVRRMREQKFEAWPNEAGFHGLTEVRGPICLPVQGIIPAWAAGTLFRTGPGQYNVEDTPVGTYRTTHWFDGFGHSHKFDIIPDTSNGSVRVEYTSRRQTEGLVETIRRTGRRHNFSFGQRRDPCVGLFGKIMTIWRMPTPQRSLDADNVSVTVQANVPGLPSALSNMSGSETGDRSHLRNIWLTTDTNSFKEVDPDTMEAISFATQDMLHPILKGPLSCAHAQRDPDNGDMFNYNLDTGRFSTYRIFRANAATGTTDILATISQPDVKPAYIHSLFLTHSFVILCVPSTHFGLKGLKVVWERNVVDAIEPFDDSKLCKWFIVDRRGDRGVVATAVSPAGFFFHSVNAFEEVDSATGDINVFCDLIGYPTPDILRSFELDVLCQNKGMTQNFWGDEKRNRNAQARFARHKFIVPRQAPSEVDTKTREATHETILEIKAPLIGELPTINPNFATTKYRYVYSLPNRGYSTLLDSIVKTDLLTRESIFWNNPMGHTPGEAIFVPRPKGAVGEEEPAEDDGVLLSVVLDGFSKTSYLVCLDAQTMEELGRAECEWAVALGFHGIHAPANVTASTVTGTGTTTTGNGTTATAWKL